MERCGVVKTTWTTMATRLSLLSLLSFSAVGVNADVVRSWPEVSGDVVDNVYTVPADTTVEVGTDDFAEVDALAKVVFADSTSVMRFTATTPPTVKFQGPGTVLFAVAPVLTGTWHIGRNVEAGKESDFTRFVFEQGISNATPESARYANLGMEYTTNTIIKIDGLLGTNINFETSGYGVWNGRFDLGENFRSEGDRKTYFGYGSDASFAVVRQRGGTISPPGSDSAYLGGKNGVAAYFLEGGMYQGSRDYFRPTGDYAHFWQTGGVFTNSRFQVDAEADPTTAVRKDFIFGGNGKAFFTGRTTMKGELLFAFNDSAEFNAPYAGGQIAFNMYYATNSIWAYNGGVADFTFYNTFNSDTSNNTSGPTNAFHAFNGGVRCFSTGSSANAFGHSPKIRVYEKGAEIRSGGTIDGLTGEMWEPEGKVLKSIALNDEARIRVWPAPPSVHITDSTGYGAAAVVGYDFDTGRITNITVMSKGENYTAPTANLRYRQGERLLSEDLACEIGDEASASYLIFSARKPGARLQPNMFTNHLACTVIVDMDMDGIADHGKTNTSAAANAFAFRYAHGGTVNKGVYFPECTNIVLKSGELCAGSFSSSEKYQYGFNHDYVLPKCYRLELYGGHLTGGTARFADIVLGGEVWLYSNRTNALWQADLHTTHDNTSASTGCLTIDAARGTNGTCTSVLKGGQVNFIKTASANSTVTVKNWRSVPASRSFKVLLDLSETTVNQNASFTSKVCVPDIVYPEGSEEELRLKWELDPDTGTRPYRLLGRRVADGTVLIFR